MPLDLAPMLNQAPLETAACISRKASAITFNGRSYVPIERFTAYFDDHKTQCRTVVEVGVTVTRSHGRRRKQPRSNQHVEVRIARLNGFDAVKGRWGDAGYAEERHHSQDVTDHYHEAFAFTEQLLGLAQSDAFAEFEKTGMYYRRH